MPPERLPERYPPGIVDGLRRLTLEPGLNARPEARPIWLRRLEHGSLHEARELGLAIDEASAIRAAFQMSLHRTSASGAESVVRVALESRPMPETRRCN